MGSALFQLVPLLLLLALPSSSQTITEIPNNRDSVVAHEVGQIRLGEILISTPQPYDPEQVAKAQHKAEMAREAIRRGDKFEDIAKQYSDAPSAASGGARPGLIKPGQFPKEIDDKIFAMKMGDISDVIRTKQGFVILKVMEGVAETDRRGCRGPFDILSDTRGVDFSSYLERMCQNVNENWYHLIPESDELKKGQLAIEFAIMKDGHVANMRLAPASGDINLDRPAWGSIVASSPFPPLPSNFTGESLVLRFRFYYNPNKGDLEIPGNTRSPSNPPQ